MFYWKQILWIFSLFLDFWHKNFGLAANPFQQVRQNCFLCVQRMFLIGLFFVRNFMSFSPSLGREESILEYLRKVFKMFVETAFYVYKGNFGEYLNFEERKTFTIFSCSDELPCELLSIIFPPGFKKCMLGLFRENFWLRFSFSSKKVPVFPRKLSDKFFGVLYKPSDSVVRTAFYVSRVDFWRTYFFQQLLQLFHLIPDCEEKIYQEFGGKVSQGCEKCISSVQTSFLRKLSI